MGEVLLFIGDAALEQFFGLLFHPKAACDMGIGLHGDEKAVFAVALTGIFVHVGENIECLITLAQRGEPDGLISPGTIEQVFIACLPGELFQLLGDLHVLL